MKRLKTRQSSLGWLTHSHKQTLLKFARKTIQQFLVEQPLPPAEHSDPELNRKQGAFVTLLKEDQLRGCVGHVKDDLPIHEVVGLMALQSAFNDHRFAPLTIDELSQVEIEISVLSLFKKIKRIDQIELGRDGVSLIIRDHHAVFLPEVPLRMGWDTEQLLDRLSNKMGLPEKSWKRNSKLYVFQTEVFRESDYQ
jgi:AmmeMemoRadiSam system protein A